MVGTRITPVEDQSINDLVEQGKFMNKSDFLRTAVRAELVKHKEDERDD